MMTDMTKCVVKPEETVSLPSSATLYSPLLKWKLNYRDGDGDQVYGGLPTQEIFVDDLKVLHQELEKFISFIEAKGNPP